MDKPTSRRDALRAGMNDADLRRLCRQGKWRRVGWGFYVPRVRSTDEEQHRTLLYAAREAVHEDAVVSFVSAAVLHRCDVWYMSLKRAHFTRNRPNGAHKGKSLTVHSGSLAADDVTDVDGMRVTSVARTVLDIARTARFDCAVVIGDSALHRRLTSSAEIQECFTRLRRCPGARAARQVVEFLDGRSESVGESLSRVLLRRAGFDTSEIQAQIFTGAGECVARVDFLFPKLGVIGEFDGLAKYKKEDLRGDLTAEEVVVLEKKREDRLRALGWIVVRWTWEELARPDLIVARIREAAEIAATSRRAGYWRPTPRP